MSKIKILVTVGSLGVGGNEMFVMNLFRHIDKSKFQMDFAVFDRQRLDYYDEVKRLGGQVFFCDSTKSGKISQMIDQKRKVDRLLKEHHYDIIHCNSCSFFGMLPGIAAGKKNGLKVISHSHGVGMQGKGFIDIAARTVLRSIISKNVDYGFSCSDLAGNSKYTETFINSEKYVVIRNAIEVSEYLFNESIRDKIRKEIGLNDKDFVIGQVGRFEKEKNHSFSIEIFNDILRKNNNSKLLLIGDGSLIGEIKRKVKDMKFERDVIFLGQRDDVNNLYNTMDCLVMPSLYEGFPFVLVEAQINGLKCIVSDVISRDVNVSGKVKFLPLDEREKWIEEITMCSQNRETTTQDKNFIKDYDLSEETKRIEQYYIKLVSTY